MSQEQLATELELSPQTIQLIEVAKYMPSVVLAQKIAGRFETTVEALFSLNPVLDGKHASRDERIEFESYRYAFGIMLFLVFGSLIAANVFFATRCSDDVGITLGAVWGVGAILYLSSTIAIRGFWSYSRAYNRRATSLKRRIFSSLISGLIFATLMQLSIETDKSSNAQILRFAENFGYFSVLMYVVNYFEGRIKSKKNPG